MWSWKKKGRPRRPEARKGPSEAGFSLWQRFRDASGPMGVLLAACFYVGVLLMDAWPVDPLPYRPGQYVARDITARIDFSVPSRKKTDDAIKAAQLTTPATFTLDANAAEPIVAGLKSLPEQLSAATQPADLPETLQKQMGAIDGNGLAAWRAYTQPAGQTRYDAQIERIRAELIRLPIVRQKEKEDQDARGAGPVWVGRELRPAADLVGVDDAKRIEADIKRIAALADRAIRPGVESYLHAALSGGAALYRYDNAATTKSIDDRIRKIEADPPSDTYSGGSILVRRRPVPSESRLAEADLRLLAEEQRQFLAAERQRTPWMPWLRLAGRAAVLLLVVALVAIYVARYQPVASEKTMKAVSLGVLLLALLGTTKVLCQVFSLNPFAAIFPVLTCAFILVIAYDQRFALAMSGILAMMIVFQLRGDLSMLLVLVAGVAVAVAGLREIRTTSRLPLISLAAAATVLLGTWAEDLASGVPWWPFALVDGAWGAVFAVLAGFFVLGILPLIERAFGAATSMTLLQWCDANKPLLRRLSIEAQGTYNHSLQLGTICETAAETIGARGLLVRVGAYYHDIGKINKPDYFVENQAGAQSRHAKLSPAMSLLIITGHVKDGLELAKEYAVPKMLHEFIASHHGTTLVQFFYNAATERRKFDVERAPDEVEFRYPGPKPRSKEAAILMLADAAESSLRALQEPTPGRIENQVHAMVTRRLMDGQLDDCNLTLKEVHRIEESLVKSLIAMHHGRVAYPTPAGATPSAAEMPAPAKTDSPAANSQQNGRAGGNGHADASRGNGNGQKSGHVPADSLEAEDE